MPVESRCRLVFGIHHQGKGGNPGTGGTVERISQQRTAQTLALESLIDSQAAHTNGGHGRIARQLLAGAGRKIGQQQACRCQGVVASCARPIGQGHEAGGHATANVLGDLFAQVAVQLLRIAVERLFAVAIRATEQKWFWKNLCCADSRRCAGGGVCHLECRACEDPAAAIQSRFLQRSRIQRQHAGCGQM